MKKLLLCMVLCAKVAYAQNAWSDMSPVTKLDYVFGRASIPKFINIQPDSMIIGAATSPKGGKLYVAGSIHAAGGNSAAGSFNSYPTTALPYFMSAYRRNSFATVAISGQIDASDNIAFGTTAAPVLWDATSFQIGTATKMTESARLIIKGKSTELNGWEVYSAGSAVLKASCDSSGTPNFSGGNGTAVIGGGAGDSTQIAVPGLTTSGVAWVSYVTTATTVADTIASYSLNTPGYITIRGKFGWSVGWGIIKK